MKTMRVITSSIIGENDSLHSVSASRSKRLNTGFKGAVVDDEFFSLSWARSHNCSKRITASKI